MRFWTTPSYTSRPLSRSAAQVAGTGPVAGAGRHRGRSAAVGWPGTSPTPGMPGSRRARPGAAERRRAGRRAGPSSPAAGRRRPGSRPGPPPAPGRRGSARSPPGPPESIASGLMVRSTSSPWPLTVAVTSPPPAAAFHLRVGQLLLRAHQLLLHLLRRQRAVAACSAGHQGSRSPSLGTISPRHRVVTRTPARPARSSPGTPGRPVASSLRLPASPAQPGAGTRRVRHQDRPDRWSRRRRSRR